MKKVLVVDDSKTIRTICEWMYKSLEDRMFTADSAEQARQVIQSESPDIIVVDYTLPDMDAYEFVASIKDKAKVVMMGGTYAAFDADKAISNGAVSTIMKPFKTADFFAAMNNLIPSESAPAAAPAAPAAAPAETKAAPKPLTPAPAASVSAPSVAPVPTIASPGGLPKPGSLGLPKPGSAVPSIGTSSIKPVGSVQPAPAARRFNFPGATPATEQAKPADDGTPSAKVTSVVAAIPASQAATSSESSVVAPAPEHATPKTPVPSISPAVQSANHAADGANTQIDPEVLRAEVMAAVKSMLPAIVNSYLKKLIQAEVKPQLQHWVDARVEALVKKMMQQ